MIGGMILLGCAFLAAGIGSWKQAGLEGLFLGLVCGPLGVVAALVPDNRRICLKCSGRLGAKARTCPDCQAEFDPRKSSATADFGDAKKTNAAVDQWHADWMAGRKGKR